MTEKQAKYTVSVETSQSGQNLIREKVSTDKIGWALSILMVAVSTGLGVLFSSLLELVDIAMLYLLGVLITSSRATKWPALLSALLSVAAFDFFFVPPRFTLAVADPRYLVTFAVMFIVALVTSGMTLRIRQQAYEASQKEKRTAALYDLSRDLVRERDMDRMKWVAEQHIGKLFDSSVAVILSDSNCKLIPPSGGFRWNDREAEAAQWALETRQPSGLKSLTGPDAESLYLPLIASSGAIGVVGVHPRNVTEKLDREQLEYLETFINQTGIAIERALPTREGIP